MKNPERFIGKKIRLEHLGEGTWFRPYIIDRINNEFIGVKADGKNYRFSTNYDWVLCEPEPEEFQEKTLNDFPLVEFWCHVFYCWREGRYMFSDSTQIRKHVVCLSGTNWVYHTEKIRPIQKVDVEELKQRARLV